MKKVFYWGDYQLNASRKKESCTINLRKFDGIIMRKNDDGTTTVTIPVDNIGYVEYDGHFVDGPMMEMKAWTNKRNGKVQDDRFVELDCDSDITISVAKFDN